jgi:hypothetical protein
MCKAKLPGITNCKYKIWDSGMKNEGTCFNVVCTYGKVINVAIFAQDPTYK